MTKDEITAKIKDCQTELAEVKKALSSARPQGSATDQPAELNRHQIELETEIAGLKSMLDEL